jgi:hypothetical protein
VGRRGKDWRFFKLGEKKKFGRGSEGGLVGGLKADVRWRFVCERFPKVEGGRAVWRDVWRKLKGREIFDDF